MEDKPFFPVLLERAARDEPLFRRVAELVGAKGIDPRTAVLADFFEDDKSFYFGLLTTPAGQVFQFGYDYRDADPTEGVATPFWGPDSPEFALPPDFGARLRYLSPIYLYHSRDDAEVPVEHLKRYRRALPQATVRILDGRGHEFNQAHFPELVADIRGLALPRAPRRTP